MSNWSDYFFIFILGAALLLSVIGVWFAAVISGIDRWSKRFFLYYFIVFALCCLSGLVDSLFLYYRIPGAAYFPILFLECLLLSLPLPMLTVYLLHCCGEDLRSSKLLRTVAGLWAVYSVLLASTLFIGGFADATPDNLYTRGPLYPFVLLPMVVILMLNIVGTIRRRARLSRKVYIAFLVALLPMSIALIIHLFFDVFALLDISYVLSMLSMYSFVLSDQIEEDRRQQREIARQQLEITRQQLEIANQRASVMVLQMRPHFIYNTMTSIYYLCNEDPQMAQQVVMDFTTYLRKNFTAVASATPILFASELEHTRAYLAVEQALYKDILFVDYDTPHTWFRVPPLTLQPLVENAVKHGRDQSAKALHISVRTRKTDSGSEIVVADDGRGYNPPDDDAPHIALKNIRQRLEIMCGGHLTIASNDGGGTVVTVTIPDSAAE